MGGWSTLLACTEYEHPAAVESEEASDAGLKRLLLQPWNFLHLLHVNLSSSKTLAKELGIKDIISFEFRFVFENNPYLI